MLALRSVRSFRLVEVYNSGLIPISNIPEEFFGLTLLSTYTTTLLRVVYIRVRRTKPGGTHFVSVPTSLLYPKLPAVLAQ